MGFEGTGALEFARLIAFARIVGSAGESREISFLAQGDPAVRLTGFPSKVPAVHPAKDMIDRLEGEGADEVGRFLLALLRGLELLLYPGRGAWPGPKDRPTS
ncbi:MAG: hypothetical protein HXY45_09465 [Syntrophaceae bacterium]|nr:hypothetical protein [Syntrophaceae bacterium]